MNGARLAVLALACLSVDPVRAADLDVRVTLPVLPAPLPSVVYVEPAAGHFTPRPGATAVVDQINKQFAPQVSVIETGTTVSFPNRDNIRHHVYSFSPAKPFELKLYSGKPSNPVLFDHAGVVTLGCNIHDVMLGYVVVVDTPFHAITDAQGLARIHGLPPGDYHLHAWTPGVHQGEHPVQLVHLGAGADSVQHSDVPAVSDGSH